MRLISAALATLERSDRDASPRFFNRDLPRRALDLPRSIPVLPRSPVEVPRSILVLPRSGFALPRFAAKPSAARVADRLRSPEGCASSRVLGFTFPHPTGLFTPVAAFCRDPRFRALHFMGVFTPVAAAPAHPRFAWARTVYPRCKRNAKSPQSPPFCRGRWVCGFAAEPAFAKCRATRQQQPTAPPRVLLSSVVVSRKRPHRGERFSPSGENSRSR